DEAGREIRSAVPEAERRRRDLAKRAARRVDALDGVDRARDLTAVRARVHEDRAADRTRDALRVLEPAEPARDRGARETAELHGGARAHATVRLPRDPREPTTELHDDAAHPAVPDEHVRAAAEERHAHAVRTRGAQHVGELVRPIREDEHVRRPADAEGRVAREGLADARPVAEPRP